MRRWAILSALLLANAAPATAEVNCAMVSALMRIHAGQTTLEQAAGTADPSVALGPLATDLNRLNGQSVDFALRDTISADDRMALADLADLTSQFATLADGGDVQALRRLIQSPQTIQVFADATAALNRAVCPADSTPLAAFNDGQAGSTPIAPAQTDTSSIARIDALNLSAPLTFFAAGTLAVLLIAGCIWFQIKRAEVQRRRSKRFPANRPITYLCKNQNRRGHLHDISGLGAKISHDGDLIDLDRHKVTLVLAGSPKTGRVAWSNENYAGIAFDQPLPRHTLQHYLATPEGSQTQAAE